MANPLIDPPEEQAANIARRLRDEVDGLDVTGDDIIDLIDEDTPESVNERRVRAALFEDGG